MGRGKELPIYEIQLNYKDNTFGTEGKLTELEM